MCVLPFLVPQHRNPLTTFYGEWLAAALGLVASALLLRRASWQPFRFPVVALVPLGLMVVLGVQVAAGLAVYWQQHFLVGLYLLWAALLVVLGAELRREFGLEKLVPVLAWAVLTGGVLSAAIVGVQMSGFDLTPYIVSRKGAGYGANLMQVNHLADYLGLALASLLYLVASNRIKTGLAAILALVVLFPLALTGQRMGWIYVVMLSVGSWWLGRKAGRQSWRALWLIPAFMALQVVIPLLPITGAPAMATQKVVQGLQGSSIRIQFIKEAWEIFLAHPWLGAGWGQFAWQDFLLAGGYSGHLSWTSHAHNILMQLLAETGLAGALLFLAGLSLWLRSVVCTKLNPHCLWIYAVLAVAAVHSLLEYPLWYAYFLGFIALLLGLAEEKMLTWKLDLGPVMVGTVMAFGTLSLGNLGLHYTALEGWFARIALTPQMETKVLNRMLDEMMVIHRRSLLTPYIDLVIERALSKTSIPLQEKLALNTQAMRFMPSSQLVYANSHWLMLAGKSEAAQQQLKRALIRYPENADPFAFALVKANEPETLPLLLIVLHHNQVLDSKKTKH